MARRYEIEVAFRHAIKISDKGRRTVTTVDFVTELAKRNWILGAARSEPVDRGAGNYVP